MLASCAPRNRPPLKVHSATERPRFNVSLSSSSRHRSECQAVWGSSSATRSVHSPYGQVSCSGRRARSYKQFGILGASRKMAAASVRAVMVTYRPSEVHLKHCSRHLSVIQSAVLGSGQMMCHNVLSHYPVLLHSLGKTKYYRLSNALCTDHHEGRSVVDDPQSLRAVGHYKARSDWRWRAWKRASRPAKIMLARYDKGVVWHRRRAAKRKTVD